MYFTRISLAASLVLLATTNAGAAPAPATSPAALQEFLQTRSAELPTNLQQLPAASLRRQLDRLCQQRDCHASRLYWYTDLKQAQAAAQASNKPILSLRLLGNLDEELSCANSRLFRIALYPNAEISQYLRDNYILHWQSVRPVPQVTIDYGDGRQLKRTLTGNSIHYILNDQGKPIDALPGLYGPQAFLQQLKTARRIWSQAKSANPDRQAQLLQDYHIRQLQTSQALWVQDLKAAGLQPTEIPNIPTNTVADDAGRLAMSKMLVERPLVSAALGFSATVDRNLAELEKSTDTTTWLKIANLHRDQAKLDRQSLDLMLSKNSSYRTLDDPRFQRTVAHLETAMAIDTARNEYLLRTKLHQWFVEGKDTSNIDRLNEKVYAQLFLTPNSDPWLGLVSEGAYSAIEGDGIQPKRQ